MTRTDAKNAFTVGGYRMQPVVRVHDDGSASLLYWVAVNKDAKRGEFVVGPREGGEGPELLGSDGAEHLDRPARWGGRAHRGEAR